MERPVDETALEMPTPDSPHVGAAAERWYPRQNGWFYLELSLYWFALSFLWSGLITIVMQKLIERMAGVQKDLYLGYSLALGALVSTVVCLVAGSLSDRSRSKMGRRRPFLIWGTVFTVPVLLWLSRVQSIPELVVVFCLLQLWVNVATAPYQALVPDLVPKERQGTASAYMGLGSLVGQLGGLVLCGLLIDRPGGLFTITVVLSALLVGTMLYSVWRIPEQAAPTDGVQSTLKTALIDSFRVKPREHPDFFWLIASRFVINVGFYSATQFLSYYVSDTLRAPNPTQTLMYFMIISTVSGLIGNFPAGLLSDRMSKKLVVYVSLGLTAVAATVFLLTSSIPVAYAAAFIFGAGFGAFAAVDWALATNLLPGHDEAKFMGVWHAAFTVPQVVAPAIGGAIAYVFNTQFGQGVGYRAVLFMVLVYLGIGALLIRPIRERAVPKVL
jgi:Na+/melibiose symporter-like transporter